MGQYSFTKIQVTYYIGKNILSGFPDLDAHLRANIHQENLCTSWENMLVAYFPTEEGCLREVLLLWVLNPSSLQPFFSFTMLVLYLSLCILLWWSTFKSKDGMGWNILNGSSIEAEWDGGRKQLKRMTSLGFQSAATWVHAMRSGPSRRI